MKKLLTIYFLLQFSFGYTQCIEGDCKNGTGTYKYEDGTILEGNWNGGLLNGKGEITYKNGTKEEGHYKDGELNGQGKITYKNGTKEEGHYKDGELNGQGKITYKNGTKEEGHYKDGELNGQGKITYKNGITDEGEFKDGFLVFSLVKCVEGDCENGKGTYKDDDGSVYKGDWKDRKKEGYGTYKCEKCKTFYEGEWKNDLENGKGIKTWKSGQLYSGEWKDGWANGQGKAILKNGTKEEGHYKDGQLNGQGKITYKNGTKEEGHYKDGELNGQGKITYKNGTKEEGHYKDGELNGQGKITYKNGTKEEGHYKDGELNGQGKITYKNGTKEEGHYKDGELNGQGKITYKNGTINEGRFEKGWLVQGKRIYKDGTLQEGEFKKGKFKRATIQINDIDGNPYNTVKVGKQIWFSEDLKTTRFSNGDKIPNLTENWTSMSIKAINDPLINEAHPAMCYYDGDKTLAPLYNGYVAVDSRNVCPTGFRVPTSNDFNILIKDAVGENKSNISNLKSKDGWIDKGNNSSGFNLKGRGLIYGSGEFGNKFKETVLLTKSKRKSAFSDNSTNIIILNVLNDDYKLRDISTVAGGTIRCVKD